MTKSYENLRAVLFICLDILFFQPKDYSFLVSLLHHWSLSSNSSDFCYANSFASVFPSYLFVCFNLLKHQTFHLSTLNCIFSGWAFWFSPLRALKSLTSYPTNYALIITLVFCTSTNLCSKSSDKLWLLTKTWWGLVFQHCIYNPAGKWNSYLWYGNGGGWKIRDWIWVWFLNFIFNIQCSGKV